MSEGLVVEGLDVFYGPVSVVRDLSFEVAPGECVALVGPNGAGKTTTLSAIMGLVPARKGSVRVGDQALLGRRPEAVARSGVALVPEGRHLFPAMTVDENLRLGLTGRRAPDGVAEDRAWVADLFPAVRDFGARRAGDLSGGQQQQVAIARALIARPDVLLLDEPSLGLAPKTVESVFEALTEVRKRGVTVLLVEQRAQLAVGFCDRTYVMAAGEIRLTLGPKDANDTGRIIAAYFS
ncbi:MAG TPA: ABC transporter ATP-binding protein [Capillimicrobium sp.]